MGALGLGVMAATQPDLACSHRRFQAWTQASPDLICVIGRDGVYKQVVSGRDVEAVGDPANIVGKHATAIGNPAYGKETIDRAIRAMDSGEMNVWYFRLPVRPDIDYEARFLDCGPNECLILVRDVTDTHRHKRKLEEAVLKRTAQLQASNDELRQFAYAASHDLREPLGKIKAFGARLEARYAEVLDQRGTEYLRVMRSAADRMMVLIDDLLEYSRVGGDDEKVVSVDVNTVIAEVFSLFSERLAGADVHCDENLPTVQGDRSQLYTLFQNLISNSLKFKKPDKIATIRITSHPTDTHDVVQITDDGIGFDAQYAEKIFLIFERLHTRFNYPGTGIGLALCRRIAERHGGFITGSGRPGDGATFRVGFPRKT